MSDEDVNIIRCGLHKGLSWLCINAGVMDMDFKSPTGLSVFATLLDM